MTNYSTLKILIINILLTSLTTLSAQAGFESLPKISLKTVWKKGESYQYELKKGKKSFLDAVQENHSETRQLVTLTVLEASAKGYIMEADYQSAAYFLPEDLKKINSVQQLVEKYSHTKVRYAINPDGEFLGILNGREIQKMLVELFDALESSKKLMEAEAIVLTNMRCQMTSEAYITEGVFQELHLLHQFYGNEYQHDIIKQYDTQLANMLQPKGAPIPARATLKVSMKDDNYCLVEHHLTPDALRMKKLTFDYLNKMSGGTWQAENIESLGMIVQDEGTFAYHLRSGWLVEMLKKRTTTLDNEKTVEYVSMKLLEKGSF